MARGSGNVGRRAPQPLAGQPGPQQLFPAPNVNLIVNPNFEHDTTGAAPAGWLSSIPGTGKPTAGATLTVDATQSPPQGTKCMKVVTTSAVAIEGAGQTVYTPALTGDQIFQASVWLKGAVGGEQVTLDFSTNIGHGGPNITLTTTWTQYTVTWSSLNPAWVNMTLSIYTQTATAMTFYVDQVMCNMGVGTVAQVPLLPYFDGDVGGAWSGTPGNSTSLQATTNAAQAKTAAVAIVSPPLPPQSVSSGTLLGWYKADAGPPPTDGSFVNLWVDASGAGHIVQPTQLAQPIVNANKQNGLPAVTFIGTEGMSAPVPSSSSAVTLFCVASGGGQFGNGIIMELGAGLIRFYQCNGSGQPGIFIQGGSSIFAGSQSPTNAGIYTAVVNGASSLVRMNGTQVVAGNPGVTPTYAEVDLGGPLTSGGSFIAEAIFFTGALTTADMQTVENYLTQKWFPSPVPVATAATSASAAVTAPVSLNVEPSQIMANAVSTATCLIGAPIQLVPIARATTSASNFVVEAGVDLSPTASAIAAATATVSRPVRLSSGFDASLISGLQGWWAADDLLSALNNGDGVTSWGAHSGNGPAVGNTGSLRPTFLTGIQNGLPTIRYIGGVTEQHLDGVSTISSNGGTVFVVSSFAAATFDDFRAAYYASGVGSPQVFVGSQGAATWFAYSGSVHYWHDSVSDDATRTGPIQSFHCDTQTLNANVGLTHTPIIGGWPGQTGRTWNGDIAEVLIFNTVLSSTDRQAVENYLSNKWGLGFGSAVAGPTANAITAATAFVTAPALLAPAPNVNLIFNPNFEHDTTGAAPAGWATTDATNQLHAGAVITVDATQSPPQGTKCMKVVTDGAFAGEGTGQIVFVPANGGLTFQSGWWMKGAVGGEAVSMNWGSGFGNHVQNYTLTTTWTFYSFPWNLSGNPVYNNIAFHLLCTTAAAITFYVDQVIVNIGPSLFTYFDGDIAGDSWTATVGNSVSNQPNVIPTGAISAATAFVNAPIPITPIATATTVATELVRAITQLSPTAQASAQATELATAQAKITVQAAQATAQALNQVAVIARLTPSASAKSAATNLVSRARIFTSVLGTARARATALVGNSSYLTFPQTPVLDNFNRVNEDPLNPTNWFSAFDRMGTAGQFAVISNAVAIDNPANGASAAWNTVNGGDSEVYVDLTSMTNTGFMNLWIALQALSTTVVSTGYQIAFNSDTGGAGIYITRYDAGVQTTILDGTSWETIIAGDSIGVRLAGGVLSVWRKPSGGSWYQMGAVVDTTYTGGYTGIECPGGNAIFDNFGGGSLAVTVFITPTASATAQATETVAYPIAITLTASAITQAIESVIAVGVLTPTAQAVGAATELLTAQINLTATASTVTQATELVTAATPIVPSASAITTATELVNAPYPITPIASATTQATNTVTATAVPLLTPTASAIAQTSNFVTAPCPISLTASATTTAANAVKTIGVLTPTAQAITQATEVATTTSPIVATASAITQTSNFATALALLTPTASAMTQAVELVTAATFITESAQAQTQATELVTAAWPLTETASAITSASNFVTAAPKLTETASVTTQATLFVTAPAPLVLTASATTSATELATAASLITESASAITQATETVVVFVAITANASATTQASELVTAAVALTESAQATTATANFVQALQPTNLFPSTQGSASATELVTATTFISETAQAQAQATELVSALTFVSPQLVSAQTQATAFVSATAFISETASIKTSAVELVNAPALIIATASATTQATEFVSAAFLISPSASSQAQATEFATAASQLAATASSLAQALVSVSAAQFTSMSAQTQTATQNSATAASALSPAASALSAATNTVQALLPTQIVPTASATTSATNFVTSPVLISESASAIAQATDFVNAPVLLTETASGISQASNFASAAVLISASGSATTQASASVSANTQIIVTASTTAQALCTITVLAPTAIAPVAQAIAAAIDFVTASSLISAASSEISQASNFVTSSSAISASASAISSVSNFATAASLLTESASATTQATSSVSTFPQVIPTARATTQATCTVTAAAPTALFPSASAITSASNFVTTLVSLSMSASAQAQALDLVTAPAKISMSASAISAASNFVNAVIPLTASASTTTQATALLFTAGQIIGSAQAITQATDVVVTQVFIAPTASCAAQALLFVQTPSVPFLVMSASAQTSTSEFVTAAYLITASASALSAALVTRITFPQSLLISAQAITQATNFATAQALLTAAALARTQATSFTFVSVFISPSASVITDAEMEIGFGVLMLLAAQARAHGIITGTLVVVKPILFLITVVSLSPQNILTTALAADPISATVEVDLDITAEAEADTISAVASPDLITAEVIG